MMEGETLIQAPYEGGRWFSSLSPSTALTRRLKKGW
jgi:hypothetical protein